ncbi:MAG TPA: sulfur carrier protein ThiS [Longimicrobiaceae bacterium]|nr:sulfur carrier protein ThiS [Longimicrobiaceae bacterium]
MSDSIDVQINGESRAVPGGATIEELLQSLDLQPKMVVVEHNGDILRRERYGEVRVAPGDALELVHFVGGG